VSCKHTFEASLAHAATLLVTCAALSGLRVVEASGQYPQQPGAQPRPYRAPTLALAQPLDGGTVPLDKPVVVFRFVAGEPDDAIDVRSFIVAIDGVDRSTSFQLDPGSGTAWGPLGAPAAVAAGLHRGTARICSLRGTCTTTAFTVSAAAPIAASSPAGPAGSPTKRSLAAAIASGLLQAIRSLVTP